MNIDWHVPRPADIERSLGEEATEVGGLEEAPRVRPSARDARWQRAKQVASTIAKVGVPVVEGATSAKEVAIGLLQLAAEIEHALMVQYLYAASSVQSDPDLNGVNHQQTLLEIAIEEMAHLATVQNLLLLLGGPSAVHMQRDVKRRASPKNPLPFVLEQVERASLAKYVVVERPAIIPTKWADKVDKLLELATADARVALQRVGVIYALLRWMFSDEASDGTSGVDFAAVVPLPARPKLSDQDLQPVAEIEAFIATRTEWGFHRDAHLLIDDILSRPKAVVAIERVAAQGEGLLEVDEWSHFERLMGLVEAFDAGQVSVTPVAQSPTLGSHGADQGMPISHPYTRLWGEVFSRQYAMVVLSIHHALVTPRPADGSGGLRKQLAGVAVHRMKVVLGRVGRLLASLPLAAGDPSPAGPPYDLDPKIVDHEDPMPLHARHLFLLDELEAFYRRIEQAPELEDSHRSVIANLRSNDTRQREIVAPPEPT